MQGTELSSLPPNYNSSLLSPYWRPRSTVGRASDALAANRKPDNDNGVDIEAQQPRDTAPAAHGAPPPRQAPPKGRRGFFRGLRNFLWDDKAQIAQKAFTPRQVLCWMMTFLPLPITFFTVLDDHHNINCATCDDRAVKFLFGYGFFWVFATATAPLFICAKHQPVLFITVFMGVASGLAFLGSIIPIFPSEACPVMCYP